MARRMKKEVRKLTVTSKIVTDCFRLLPMPFFLSLSDVDRSVSTVQACALDSSARLFVHHGSSEPGRVGLGAGFKHGGRCQGVSIYLDTFILKISNIGEACALRDGMFLAELMGCNKLIVHSDFE
jgi:hypothetical protein